MVGEYKNPKEAKLRVLTQMRLDISLEKNKDIGYGCWFGFYGLECRISELDCPHLMKDKKTCGYDRHQRKEIRSCYGEIERWVTKENIKNSVENKPKRSLVRFISNIF